MLKNHRCDHVACKQCLLSALAVHRHCPVCRSSAEALGRGFYFRQTSPAEELIVRSRLVTSLNEALQVHCPLGVTEKRREGQAAWRSSQFRVENGCTAVVPLGELPAHLAECQFCVVSCPFKELGCQHTAARQAIGRHTSQCWFALGQNELKATAEKISELLARVDAQGAQLDEAVQTIETQKTALTRNATSVSVLQEYSSRLLNFATAVARDRVGGDPALFGSLMPPPLPNPERLKAFVQSCGDGVSFTEYKDGTASISAFRPAKKLKQLVPLLPLCPTVVYLSLRDGGAFDDKQVVVGLARALPQLFMLKQLLLDELSDTALCVLGKALPQLSSLTQLKLFGSTAMQPAGALALASGLQQCTSLESIFVTPSMETDALRAISKSLGTLPKLMSVEISSDEIDKRGIGDTGWPSCLGSFIGSSSLVQLGIRSRLPDIAGPALLGLLGQQPLFTSLHLTHCDLHRDNLMKLCKAIGSLSQLEELSIIDSCADSACIAALATSLRDCASLDQLNVDENVSGNGGAQAIAAVIPNLGCLESLSVRGCEIEEGGMVALLKAVPSCKRLTRIDLSNNHGGDVAARVLLEDVLPSCEGRRAMEDVDFSLNGISDAMRSRLSAYADTTSILVTLDDDDY